MNNYHRKSIRLIDYDYSSPGGYFATICMHNKKCILGKVVNGTIHMSSAGKIVKKYLYEIPRHDADVDIDTFIVMPNHVHGIIVLKEPVGRFMNCPYQRPSTNDGK
jgi:REP element-mobilizing transposase RayT